MEYLLLRDQVKNFIGQSKVAAACFFSYNFDSDFFENYLLPLFIPEAPFNENKIQNAILWRKYEEKLPPVLVVCDFHAKSNEAPNLGYEVLTRDYPVKEGHKPVFHCKQSYILTKDGRLMIINGSNNLVYSGWCNNIEGITIEIFENGKYFPREYKDQYRVFINDMLDEIKENEALKQIQAFLNKIKYTQVVNYHFWDSKRGTFQDFLFTHIDDNIEYAEIFSPYIYGDENLKYIRKFSADIRLLIPFEGPNTVATSVEFYKKLQEEGIKWCLIKSHDKTKEFRFNHSKIYRFKGQSKIYTIIGSVNFTSMAWKGFNNGGNYENAVLYIEDFSEWEEIIIPYSGNAEEEFRFSENKEPENAEKQTIAPKLEFSIDWKKSTIRYKNKEKYNCTWENEIQNKTIISGTGEFNNIQGHLQFLSKNPAIKVSSKGNIFIYYPRQENTDFKPLPANLKLNNEHIFKLWEELTMNNNTVQQLQLESFLREKLEDAGEWIEENESISVLNVMATHLNGILSLKKALFNKKERPELVKYYLVVDNIDTIWGYLKSLLNDINEQKIQKGFGILVCEIIRIKLFEKAIKYTKDSILKNHLKLKLEEWIIQSRLLKKEAKNIDDKLISWAVNEIKYDFK